MSKPLLVGESNPYGSPPEYDLWPLPERASGWRLCHQVLGITEERYLEVFDRANLVRGEWCWLAARTAARAVRHERAVLLGQKVATAFDLKFEPLRVARVTSTLKVLLLPHPSGLNRHWNDDRAILAARDAVRAFAPEVYQ